MNNAAAILDRVVSDLRELLRDDALDGLSDADRLRLLQTAGEASRLVDATVVETVAGAWTAFPHEVGCRNTNEVLQRTMLTDPRRAGVLDRTAGRVRRAISIVSGERLPADWPALREAMLDGAITPEGLLAATAPLEKARDRITAEERAWADESLAWCARGYGTGDDDQAQGPPLTAEDLRVLGLALATALDPDGAEPTDDHAALGRFFTIGRLSDGVQRVHGALLPEVAAQLQLIFDAYNNPKVGGAPEPGVRFRTDDEDACDEDAPDDDPFNADDSARIDDRTPGQKRHDALAAALGIAARHRDMPMLGGTAPTLVVHADIHDIAGRTGWAALPGGFGVVPLSTALHTGCTGAVQRVMFDKGRIIGITTTDRIFSATQRRAIVLRDKECLIPGCHVPASWCEIHHVTAAARDGPTSTGNGVPLCWWHHRDIDSGRWEIRMADGLPQIRGPAWWDPEQRWRIPRPSLPDRSRAASA